MLDAEPVRRFQVQYIAIIQTPEVASATAQLITSTSLLCSSISARIQVTVYSGERHYDLIFSEGIMRKDLEHSKIINNSKAKKPRGKL